MVPSFVALRPRRRRLILRRLDVLERLVAIPGRASGHCDHAQQRLDIDPVDHFERRRVMLLTRFLDSMSIGEVEFVAEMSGVREIVRRFRSGQKQGSLRAGVAARGHA